MKYKNLTITAPLLQAPGHSEAEVFGSVVWLWMNSPVKRNMPLHGLLYWLMPALKAQQYLLASALKDGQLKPVAYMAWANLNAKTESLYVNNPATGLSPEDWRTGDRMWIIDWFCPFGQSVEFSRAASALLDKSCARSLYHRGDERGLRVHTFRGDHVSRAQARDWWASRPIMSVKAFENTDQD